MIQFCAGSSHSLRKIAAIFVPPPHSSKRYTHIQGTGSTSWPKHQLFSNAYVDIQHRGKSYLLLWKLTLASLVRSAFHYCLFSFFVPVWSPRTEFTITIVHHVNAGFTCAMMADHRGDDGALTLRLVWMKLVFRPHLHISKTQFYINVRAI